MQVVSLKGAYHEAGTSELHIFLGLSEPPLASSCALMVV